MNETVKEILNSFVLICATAFYVLLAIALPPMLQFYAVMVYGAVFDVYASIALYACSLMWAAVGIASAKAQRDRMVATK